MSKTSDWKIVATEGATVDGRTITATWIKDMAEQYSTDEYTAMVWPEHFRSSWAPFDGKNWGVVEEVKAAKFKDKLRLFAKITPNKYLLDANADGQKLFTSIEPNPDYKGQGRCYLEGLAVTDSPASTGTTRLKFSKGGDHAPYEMDCSQLEELDLSDCFTTNPLAQAFSTLAKYFSSGGELPQNLPEKQHDEDTDVTEEQLKTALKEQFSVLKTELKEELKQEFSQQPNQDVEAEAPAQPPQTFNSEQFSTELEKQLKPFAELPGKIESLENKFNELSQEAPGQRPDQSGANDKMEVF
ncbi:GPO family capsid scaffolding protein [Photobacterium sp. OFAV2-7]|uniref:GPO family capsid scaffolding protein n=1 Tax=Photobacterium sp. OFAV2-7 TaxID=2917748 RepID=UPI001EF46041|nr:GPO family capsid scaffolding protein [Photobacterium sp. OFAV2-7]MCG7585662.1 GPO family capsid scaffolding protein [Photobacterium sp. OFAV2-7]